MFWLFLSLFILTLILLGVGFCCGGPNGFIIALILCGFLWWKGCSAYHEREAEQRREQIELLKLEEKKRARQAVEERQRQAQRLAQEQENERKKQEKARREQAFLDFTRVEMAQALQAHAEMGREIGEQERRLARLAQVLTDLDKSVMWNWEYRTQNSKLSDMRELQEDLWECVEATYIESVKCETFRGNNAVSARQKAIHEGRKEAESIVHRFEEMRQNK